VRKVEALRTFTESIMAGDVSIEDVRASAKSDPYHAVDSDVFSRAELYAAVGHSASLKGLRFHSAHYTMFDGVKGNFNKWLVERTAKTTSFGNMPKRLVVADTKDEAIAKFKKLQSTLAEKDNPSKNTRFDIYSNRHDKTDVFIGKKIGSNVVRIKEGFTNVKDARVYLAENQAALDAALEKMKSIPAHRKSSNSPRVGADHRNGGDVTPEAFGETFGFRGVQFGNYVEQGRRQTDLNQAYDSLMDLAGVIGVPAKAISLNGELGLAFGARGKGGKRPAAAHYEPGQIVINLTKNSGAGSLAHEWWHSLDNYFGRERGAGSSTRFATDGMPADSIRPEMAEAFKKIRQTVNRSKLKQRSQSLDKVRTKAYWSTDIEMTARSFESYVIEKLKDQNASNDYLANIVSEEYWKASEALGMEDSDSYPYPEAAEIPEIRTAYDAFFEVVESKEADDGSVAMFSREGEFRRSPTQATPNLTTTQAETITSGLMEGWEGKPDVIITDSLAQFPQKLREAIRKAGAESDMRGVFFDGKVYILASRIPSQAALEEVVLHEVVGHYGLRTMMGADLKPLLNQVYLSFAKSAEAKKIIRNYFPNGDFSASNSNHRLTVAEELLAHLAETGKHQKLWNKIVAAVREGLRKLGFTLQMTEADLLGILAGAQKTVQDGGISRVPSQAAAMSRAGRSGSDRAVWPDNFPKVQFAAPLGSADKHPRYQAAKSGDVEAARELVNDLVNEAAIDRVRKVIGARSPIVVSAFAEEATGRNMIPVAYAAKIAKALSLTVDQGIIQSTRVKRTGEGSDYRLANHAVFEGDVASGQDYLIVDDTLTMGGTLASLRGHIEANGGRVIGATTLTGFGSDGQLALSDKMRQDLWRKHGEPLNEYLQEEFGYDIDSLTQGEAGHFRKAASLDAIRERINAARIESGNYSPDGVTPSSFSRSSQTDTEAFQKWFGDSKIVDENGEPLTVYHGTNATFTEFSRDQQGSNTAWENTNLGFYFIADRNLAQEFANESGGDTVMDAYLSIQKPLRLTMTDLFSNESQASTIYEAMTGERLSPADALDALNDEIGLGDLGEVMNSLATDEAKAVIEAAGYDGVVSEYGDGNLEYVAFNANQIKSATENNGNFDSDSADIRFSRAGDGPPRTIYDEAFDSLGDKDKTVFEKAKKLLRREMFPGGLLPESVFKAKMERDNQINSSGFDISNRLGHFDIAIEEAYGKPFNELEQSEVKKINQALGGADVFLTLPEPVRIELHKMRLVIKGLSREYAAHLRAEAVELQRQGADAAAQAKIQLLATIIVNLDTYVHRSYRAFDDPKWPRKVSREVYDNAARYLEQRYTEESNMTQAEIQDQVSKTMELILEEGTAFDSIEGFIKESKLGAKDLGILQRRKQIAPEIRALLGEYTDPKINFTKSVTKMSRLVMNQKFLDKVRELGLAEGFLFEKENRQLNATRQIAADASEVYAPLNGLYTFPEVEQAFIDVLGKEQMADWFRTIIRYNGMVKYGKTVLSPTTAARNWMSASFFAMANGHFDFTQMSKSVRSIREYFTYGEGQDGYLRKMKELGVIYDTPYAGEMMDLLADSQLESDLFSKKPFTGLRKANEIAQKFYQYGDDFWKIMGFENEKALLMKHKGLTEAQAEVEAAERIRNTYPTYSMTGRFVRRLRRFPLAGTFVSFPAEIIRTSYHILRYVKLDLQQTPTLGYRKVVGLAIASGMIHALQTVAMSMAGMDDDEEEAFRDLAAPWSKNSNLLPLGRNEKGQMRIIDMSFLDPYNYFKRPINALLRDQPLDDAIKSAAVDMWSPFFGQDIAFGAISEAMNNKKSSGGRVFNPHAPVLDQSADIANHLRKALQPGAAANIERIIRASAGEVSASGRPYSLKDEAAALVGFRVTTFDPKASIYYKSFEFKDKKRDATSILSAVAKNPNKVSDSAIRDAYYTAEKTRTEAYQDMMQLVKAGMSSGLTRRDITISLKNSGISGADIMSILRGRVPPWRPSDAMMKSAIKKAEVLFDGEVAKEFEQRRRLIQKTFRESLKK
jgi:adenine/guanine phosphoribosyltransferase-like PRPP-binding protein